MGNRIKGTLPFESDPGSNTIFYQTSSGTWTPLTIGSGVSFSNGVLIGSGSTSSLDGDLQQLADSTGTNVLYYREGNNSWKPLITDTIPPKIGNGITGPSGYLIVRGLYDVTLGRYLVVDNHELLYVTAGGTTVEDLVVGINNGGTNATTVTGARSNLGLVIGTDVQAYDSDLLALANLGGTNQFYYRSGAGAWAPVTIGANLAFSNGTLSGPGGLPAGTIIPIESGGTNAINASDAREELGLIIGVDVQGWDSDLHSLSNTNLTNVIYYRSGVGAWSPVTIGKNLGFSNGILSGSGGSAGGISSTVPVVSGGTGATTPAGARSNLGLDIGNDVQAFDPDLTSLANLQGTGVLYYRSGANTWSPVTFLSGIRFDNGKLFASGTAGHLLLSVSNLVGTVGISQGGTSATNATEALSNLGAQPLDNDLTSLAGASATNTIYYRSATDTWSPVTIGQNLGFSNGIISGSGAPKGLPAGTIIPIESGGTNAINASDAREELGLIIGTDVQAWDSDLHSLANTNLTNVIYYRSGVGAWSPVTIGKNLGFSNGILSGSGSAGGGGIPGVVPVESGGTGATTASLARDNLGLTIGSDVQGYDIDLNSLANSNLTGRIYFRSGAGDWHPVTLTSGLTLNTTNGLLGISALQSAGGIVSIAKGGTNSTTASDARTALGVEIGVDVQEWDADLDAIRTYSGPNDKIVYRQSEGAWLSVATLSGIRFVNGILFASGTASYLSLPVANLVGTLPISQGGTAGTSASEALSNLGGQPLDSDLTSLAGASSTNAIYYRASAGTWSPVTIGTNLAFAGGTLSSSAGGGLTGTVPIASGGTGGVNALQARINLGVDIGQDVQAQDSDLQSLADANLTNRIYYRSGVGSWHPVTVGSNLLFSNGTLTGPYGIPAGSVIPITSGGTGGVNASDARTSLGLEIGVDVQGFDLDLYSLSNANQTNKIYYRSGVGSWHPVTIGSNLTFSAGTLSAAGGGGGSIPIPLPIASGGTNATSQSAARTSLGLAIGSDVQQWDTDLDGLRVFGGTNSMVYRQSEGVWLAVNPISGLILNGNNGNLGISGLDLANLNITSVLPISKGGTASSSASAARINLGLEIGNDVQAYDSDLASLASAALTNYIYYRSNVGVWSPVIVASGIGFNVGNLGIANIANAGGVLPVAKGGTAGTSIAEAQTNLNLVPGTNIQAYDGDLASLAAASSTNAIYYRSAANTWSPVSIGSNLTFSAGTLSASAGGGGGGGLYSGCISLVPMPPFATVYQGTDLVQFVVPPPMNGRNINWVGAYVNTAGVGGSNTTIQITRTRSGSKVNVLSSAVFITNGTKVSSTSYTINTSNDDLLTYDVIGVDVTALSSSPPTGLTVTVGVGN